MRVFRLHIETYQPRYQDSERHRVAEVSLWLETSFAKTTVLSWLPSAGIL
jgi:hypothetical protein